MEITVKLFGTLVSRFPGYDSGKGLILEMAGDTTVADLLTFLNLSPSREETVLHNGRLLDQTRPLPPGACLHIFQALHGG
jgi:hypothetical protein